MFFRKKEEIYLGLFLRLITQSIIKSAINISELDKDKILTVSEQKKTQEELPFFRFAIVMFKLLEILKFGKKNFAPEEIGQTLGIAVGLGWVGLPRYRTFKRRY